MWKVLNGVLNKGHKPTVFPAAGDIEEDLPKNFNNYFVSIGENLAANLRQPQGASFQQYLTGNYMHSFFLKPTDRNEIFKIIMELKSSNTAGIDGISSKILKAIVDVIL